MANKKKKAKKQEYSMDDILDYQYTSLIDEIEQYQAEIKRADKKAKKKAMKKFKGNGFYPYEYQLAARERVINEMEGSNILDKCIRLFNEMKPIIKIISRLIASLIVSILSISLIKSRIKPGTLKKLQAVYEMSMSI